MSRTKLLIPIVLILTGLAIWGFVSQPPKYGLDIRGGTRLTFQMKPDEVSAIVAKSGSVTEGMLQRDLVRIMEGRAGQGLGVSEATVNAKGTNEILVELPGFTDLERAVATMGTTAKIQVYHARTVDLGRYSALPQQTQGGSPYVPFTRRGIDTTLEPGSPEYAEMIESWDLLMEGSDVTNAFPERRGNTLVPNFEFGGEGARRLEQMTRRFVNNPTRPNLAFVLDGRVLSISPVKEGTVLSSNAFIDGQFEADYVTTLTGLIKSGSLPVGLNLIRQEKVEPTIGNYALDQILQAGVISFGIVVAFLIIYYAWPGVVAALALCLYTLFTVTILKLMDATFSLAAIAGFILSVGMAIDANILVFERIKEELKAGKPLNRAVSLGFKGALNAILDSNACTILTSLVLMQFGTPLVRGFAVTLIVGVAISFFTAFIVTRALLEGAMALGIGTNPKWYALNRSWFGEKLEAGAASKRLAIVKNRGKFFLISAIIIIIPAVFIWPLNGLRPNVEYTGGYQLQYEVPAQVNLTNDSVRRSLDGIQLEGYSVRFAEFDGKRYVDMTIPRQEGVSLNDPTIVQRVAQALQVPPENVSAFSEVGPTVQEETWRNTIYMIVFSTLLIVLYLALRFGLALGGIKNGIKFGGSAVAALLHDVAFSIGLAAMVGYLLGWEVSALFITAMLTVTGFSVHDTIVVFDRVRENLQNARGNETMEEIVDLSVTQTIARSLNTSFSAILVLALLVAIGTPTPELKFMCVTMLAGILIGTYSSIFNASPILWLWDKAVIKRKGENAGLVAEAAREAKERAAAALARGTELTAAPAAAGAPGPAAGGAYGTVRRKSGVQKATKPLDEE